MKYKTPYIFTALVLLAGTAALYQSGYFTKSSLSPMVFTDMQLKVVYEGEDPELLAYIPPAQLASFPTLAGDPVPDYGSMVLGWQEARDMAKENNITVTGALWGYKLDDFLGKGIQVTGMLKKTDTLIDLMHIQSREGYDGFPEGVKITVKLDEEKMPKFFYPVDPDNPQWPAKAVFAQGSKGGYKPIKADRQLLDLGASGIDVHFNQNRTYVPLVLGSEEAKMMIAGKKIAGVGDRLTDFFGRDAYIAGILEPTGTSLDMFNYMPR